jgi:hypothetical protein
MLADFSTFVCQTNISLNMATQATTRKFCNSLIAHGIAIGRSMLPNSPSIGEHFPKVTIPQLRSEILRIDGDRLTQALERFESGYVHLSLDAATLHGNSILDFVLLRCTSSEPIMDFLLFESVNVSEASLDFYFSSTSRVLEHLRCKHINVLAIVGDGLAAQVGALSPASPNSIQNSEELLLQAPFLRNILYLHCCCHLLNLTIQDALKISRFMRHCNAATISLAHILRRKENSRRIGARCPTYSKTRWGHVFLLCRFFALHFEAILAAGIEIPLQILGFGMVMEVFYKLISEFECRITRFYMRERKLRCFAARIAKLKTKFNHIDYIVHCCDVLSSVVFVRFAHHDHQLSLVADSLSAQGLHNEEDDVRISETVHYVENCYETILNDRFITETIAEFQPVSLEEEDGDGEEEMESESEFSDSYSLDFLPDELAEMSEAIVSECQHLKEVDDEKGIFDMGVDLIEDYGERSGWDAEKIGRGTAQFAQWLGLTDWDVSHLKLRTMEPPLIWVGLGTAKRWDVLREFAQLVLSLPAAETENERLFSVRRYVVGDRGGRTKSDLVTPRVRIRTTQLGVSTDDQ